MESRSLGHSVRLERWNSYLTGKPGSIVISLTLLGLVLRVPNLGESLWLDEVLYSTSYLFSSLSDLWHLFLRDRSAPLYRVLLFFWINIFGETELSVRIPSLLFGILSIWLTYEIARAYCSPGVAFLAAGLLCVSPAHVWYSQEATPYAATMFFFLAAVLAWLRLKEQPSHNGWYAVYICMFLVAVFTHYFVAAFLVPVTLLSLAFESRSRKRIVVANAAILVTLVLALGIKHHFGHIGQRPAIPSPFHAD